MLSAHELLQRYFACAIQKDGAGFGALFAVDGTLQIPFAELRFAGPAAIGDRAQRAWDAAAFDPTDFEIDALIESETGLTAEYIVHGTDRATGAPLQVGGIAVLEVDHGQIIAMREYVR